MSLTQLTALPVCFLGLLFYQRLALLMYAQIEALGWFVYQCCWNGQGVRPPVAQEYPRDRQASWRLTFFWLEKVCEKEILGV